MADENFDALAGEYVLGTLTAEERENVERLVVKDSDFARQITVWERRLGVLEAMVEPVEPPLAVWHNICDRIADMEPETPLRLPEIVGIAPGPGASTGNAIILARRLSRWRGIAALAAAVAVALLIDIGIERYSPELLPPALRPPVETKVVEKVVDRVVEKVVEVPRPAPPSPGRFVAVLQREAVASAFLLTIDIDNRTLIVRRMIPPEPGKSHELWLVSDKLPAPRSLGLVEAGEFTQRQSLSAYDSDTIKSATYAVSLEPEGGSPTGVPTGLALFTGKLAEAVPSRP